MAATKTVKSKTKAKRGKARVTRRKSKTIKKTRPSVRKKRATKVAVRRASPKSATPAAKVAIRSPPAGRRAQPLAARPKPSAPAPPAAPGERIGVVTHYYSHLSVATLRLESGTLRVGDTIRVRRHTTDFSQRVDSLEVNHAPVTEVGPNDDFGLKIIEHAREHDVVYKVRP